MQLSTSSILQTSLLTLLFIALQEYLKVNVSKNDNHNIFLINTSFRIRFLFYNSHELNLSIVYNIR